MSYLIAQEVYKLCGWNEGFRTRNRLCDCVWGQMNNLSYSAAHQMCCCFPLVVFIPPFLDRALLIKIVVKEWRSDFICSSRRANQSDCKPACLLWRE